MTPQAAAAAAAAAAASASPGIVAELRWLGRRQSAMAPLRQILVLREDLRFPALSGNKLYKIMPLVSSFAANQGEQPGAYRVLSFGGAYSNHLHALSFAGAAFGFSTVAIVRRPWTARGGTATDEPPTKEDTKQTDTDVWTPTLLDARQMGMTVHFVSPHIYRQRHDEAQKRQWKAQFSADAILDEGGASLAAVRSCAQIVNNICEDDLCSLDHMWVSAGTGTTAAGIAYGLVQCCPQRQIHLHIVSALKGASANAGIKGQVRQWLSSVCPSIESWATSSTGEEVWHWGGKLKISFHQDSSAGGFGKTSGPLWEHIWNVYHHCGVLLDPLYSAKTSLAVEEYLTAHPEEADKAHMLVHTGGVQGMRGLLHEMTLALGKDRSAVLANAMDEFLSMLPGRMGQA